MGNGKDFSPYCNADLQGEPIPKQSQKAYGAAHFTKKLVSQTLKPTELLNGNVQAVTKSGK
ncbi:hypothetical protein [Bacillus cereus]|uniref:hypothetical protein n=1 Tax=Bacillus cereus TaxID=1396 RepID=UPI001CC2422E|nr:hypothetical protein [Bacillus cereus]